MSVVLVTDHPAPDTVIETTMLETIGAVLRVARTGAEERARRDGNGCGRDPDLLQARDPGGRARGPEPARHRAVRGRRGQHRRVDRIRARHPGHECAGVLRGRGGRACTRADPDPRARHRALRRLGPRRGLGPVVGDATPPGRGDDAGDHRLRPHRPGRRHPRALRSASSCWSTIGPRRRRTSRPSMRR